MCLGVEYVLDGEPVAVYFDSPRAKLPIKLRGGGVTFIKWGTRSPQYGLDENTPGHLLKWPEGGLATLESIRAEEWFKFDPRPVKIVASRFVQVDAHSVPHWIPLKAGEYLQGLLAHVRDEKRVYVVTVPAPQDYRHVSDRWPRVCGP